MSPGGVDLRVCAPFPSVPGQNLRPQRINTLLARLQRLDGQVHIAMEGAGHYWLPLYEALTNA
ncbi:MAG TPA: hypothetical protein ENG33_11395 [Chloroflexi bacterium]|nr:hypothetical protein [Chloroflexota bacterium]